MSWNYRVVRNAEGLRIFDVYYDSEGSPVGTNASPTYVYGESVEDLRDQLMLMLEALKEPVLSESEIGGGGNAPNPYQRTASGGR